MARCSLAHPDAKAIMLSANHGRHPVNINPTLLDD